MVRAYKPDAFEKVSAKNLGVSHINKSVEFTTTFYAMDKVNYEMTVVGVLSAVTKTEDSVTVTVNGKYHLDPDTRITVFFGP